MAKGSGEQAKATDGPPSVHILSLTMLTLLVETAAAHLSTPIPADLAGPPADPDTRDVGEAKLAIDSANALLAVVAKKLSREERLAIEGMLTQLQVDYVKRMS